MALVFFSALALLLLAYLGMFLILITFTGKFLYLPLKEKLPILLDKAAAQGISPWLNEKQEPIGWKIESPHEEYCYFILYGRYGMALDRIPLIQLIRQLHSDNASVYILEYPSYGARKGSPSQINLTQAAMEGIHLINSSCPFFIIGESLGAAVAAQVASICPQKISGLFLLTPFNKLPDIAAYRYPLFPIGPFLRDRYDSCEALKKYEGPVFVLLAENDRTSPARFGLKLYENYKGPKKLMIMAGTGHNNVSFSASAPWWEEGLSFLKMQMRSHS